MNDRVVVNPNFKNSREFHRSLLSRGVGAKDYPNTHTEVEHLGGGKFAASLSSGHRVFFDKTDGNKPKKHKLTDERPGKDYVLVQGAKCCTEVYPYYAKYFDVQHEEVRVHEERWVVQRLFKEPDKWRDVGAWNPRIAVEQYSEPDGDVVKVTVTYDTDYGVLTVEYFQRDDNNLKHNVTFKNTSGSTETFRVLQKWAGIVGAKVNDKDYPLDTNEPVLAFCKADKKLALAENLRSMIFNPDGTEKTEHCLKRPVSIEAHAQGMKADFIYGNWVLAQDESLEIDPDTATLDDPTEDGFIERTVEFCPELFEKIGEQWHSIGYAWLSSFLEDEKTVFHNLKSPNLKLMERHDPFSEINCLSMLSGGKGNSLKSVEVLYDVNLREKSVEEIIQIIQPLPCYEERLRNHLSLPNKGMISNEKAMKCLSQIDNQRIVILQGEGIKFSFDDGTDLQLCITGWSDDYIYTRYAGEDDIKISLAEAGYVEWDTSAIPDEVTITDTIFKYHGEVPSYQSSTIREMVEHRPTTSTDQEVYDEAGEGTRYYYNGFPVSGSNQSVDLGADADTDLKNLLSSDWFAIGLKGEDIDKIYSEEYTSATPKPTLYVEYNLPGAGWSGIIAGVTDPASIMGVDVANIASVKGVASA